MRIALRKAVFFGISLCVLACPKTLIAVPPAVEKAFAAKYPGTEVRRWERDSQGYWEAKFTRDGVKYRADFREDGSWRETETNIKFRDLPKAVQAAIKRDFSNEKISEIESVDNAERGRFFDVEFKRSGKNKDVEFRPNGQRVTTGN